jgi:hypothetical protein
MAVGPYCSQLAAFIACPTVACDVAQWLRLSCCPWYFILIPGSCEIGSWLKSQYHMAPVPTATAVLVGVDTCCLLRVRLYCIIDY